MRASDQLRPADAPPVTWVDRFAPRFAQPYLRLARAELADAVRRIRLLTGLVMFAYLTQHLLNHALGAVSLPLAEGALRVA